MGRIATHALADAGALADILSAHKKEKSMILAVILLFLSAAFGYAGSDLLAAIIGAASVCTALGSLVRDDLNKLD